MNLYSEPAPTSCVHATTGLGACMCISVHADILANTQWGFIALTPDESSGREGTSSHPRPLLPCTTAHWTRSDTAPSQPGPHLCQKRSAGYTSTPG